MARPWKWKSLPAVNLLPIGWIRTIFGVDFILIVLVTVSLLVTSKVMMFAILSIVFLTNWP